MKCTTGKGEMTESGVNTIYYVDIKIEWPIVVYVLI